MFHKFFTYICNQTTHILRDVRHYETYMWGLLYVVTGIQGQHSPAQDLFASVLAES